MDTTEQPEFPFHFENATPPIVNITQAPLPLATLESRSTFRPCQYDFSLKRNNNTALFFTNDNEVSVIPADDIPWTHEVMSSVSNMYHQIVKTHGKVQVATSKGWGLLLTQAFSQLYSNNDIRKMFSMKIGNKRSLSSLKTSYWLVSTMVEMRI